MDPTDYIQEGSLVSKAVKTISPLCKLAECTRIKDGYCYGWKDPDYLWGKYRECPHIVTEPGYIEKLEEYLSRRANGRD